MRTTRSVRWAASLGVVCAAAGCTSLLGDFASGGPGSGDAGDAGGGSNDAAGMDGGVAEGAPSDATLDATSDAPADDSGGADADDAGEGGASPLTCVTWEYPTPIVLDTLTNGTRLVQGALSIYTIPTGSGNNVRIVAGKNGPEPFTVYSLDRSATPPNVSALTPTTGYFSSVGAVSHRSPGKAATYSVILASTRPSSMVSATYEAFVVPDSMANTGPLPSPFPAYQLLPLQATPSSVHLLPLTATDMFTLIENPVTTGSVTSYSLGAGIATTAAPIASLSPISSSLNADDFTEMGLFDNSVNNQVYIYAQNDLSSPGLSAWSVPNTLPADAAAPTKRPIGALSAGIQAISENTTTPAADIAYVEATYNGAFVNGETFRAGTIPYTGATPDLDTWVSTDLPVARSFAGSGVYDTPLGITDGSRWASDNIMFLGPGLKTAADASNGGVPYGLNLLWIDANANVRAEGRGMNRLLPSLGDFSGVAAAPLNIGPDGKSARWAVVWVETMIDDMGSYSVISYNELACQ